jgi:predicted transcriptional regulator
MRTYSTNEVASKLGITGAALSKYIKAGKVPTPKTVQVGKMKLHSWSEADIERLRKLLPKIANGRKTRYQKKQSATGNKQPAKQKRRSEGRKH